MDVKDIESSAGLESFVVIRVNVGGLDFMPPDGHQFVYIEQENLSLEMR